MDAIPAIPAGRILLGSLIQWVPFHLHPPLDVMVVSHCSFTVKDSQVTASVDCRTESSTKKTVNTCTSFLNMFTGDEKDSREAGRECSVKRLSNWSLIKTTGN